MRRTTRALLTLSAAGALALSACGGDGGGGGAGGGATPSAAPTDLADTGNFTDPDRAGPVEIEGAQEGGTVKVISFTPLETMDPSEIYYTHTNAISTALLNRSLTQFVYDEEANQAVLVPDLATDLGTPNEDFTEWTFTIRDGVKYEDGTPVTAEDVKFGMERTMDVETFPESPGGYALEYYEGGADYEGPYTGNGAQLDSIAVDGSTMTDHDVQAVPGHALLGVLPRQRADPGRQGGRPRGVRQPPAVDRPLQDRGLHAEEVAHPGPQRPVGPRDRPGPHGSTRTATSSTSPCPASGSTSSFSTTRVTPRTR